MAHISNLTTTEFRELVDDFSSSRNWGSPGIFAGIVLWLTQRDRRFLPVKAIAYNWALSEPSFKKELKTYEILTTTHDRIGTPHTLDATSLDPKSLEWLLECYENEAEDKRGIRARANKAAPALLKEIEHMRKSKTNQLEMALSRIDGTALGACAEELTATGIGFRIVLGTAKKPECPVIFRKEADDSIVAFFPATYGDGGPGKLDCYAHVGQYSIAHIDYYREETKPAKPSEYASLLKELKGLYEKGTDAVTLKVITKFPDASGLKSYKAALEAKASVATASDYTNIDLQHAYKEFRSVMASPTVGEAIKKLWKFGVKAMSWYVDAQGGPVDIGDSIAAILEFEGELKEFGAKVKKLGVGQKTYNIMFKFLEADKKAFNEFRKTQKAKASVATAAGSSKKWMQEVSKSIEQHGTKNSLHRYFKIPEDETIPLTMLKRTLKKPGISSKTKHRILFALNARKAKHGHSKKSASVSSK